MTVYLDHNATAPVPPAVVEAVLPWLGERYGNPSSVHRLGRQARAALDRARAQVAALAGAAPEQVVFTSGGTEANNLALLGAAGAWEGRRGRPGAVAVSAVEHPSVLAAAEALEARGWRVHRLPVDGAGRLRPEGLEAALADPELALVSVMWANNETGVLQDLEAVVAAARARGVPVHSDAVQAAGKVPLSFRDAGLALLSLSAHKLGGPKGAGALVVDRALELEPLLRGGGQERGLRGGTEAVPALVGFGAAAELALEGGAEGLQARARALEGLRQRLEAGLARALPEAVVAGAEAPRVPNTTLLAVPGVDGEALVLALDQLGFCLSSGSACESGTGEPSHVLLAMGWPEALARGAVRVSLGPGNDAAQVEAFLEALPRAVAGLRRRVAFL